MASTDQRAAAVQTGSPVERLPDVSEAVARRLRRIGVATVRDLLRHFPMRYEREMAESSIDRLVPDAIGTARGTVAATRCVPSRAGGRGPRGRFEATLEDGPHRLRLIWFNAGYLRDQIHPGMPLRVHGKATLFKGYLQMVNPQWESLEQGTPPAFAEGRLRPIYPATEHLSSARIEKFVLAAMEHCGDHVVDPLDTAMLEAKCMPSLAAALRGVHAPADEEQVGAARRRLAFNELLLLQLGIALKRHYNRTVLQAPALSWNAEIDGHIRQRFPFPLTAAQDRVVAEIAADLQRSTPMNRMLQGDVGSGKTVVALYALLMAVADRRQAALMAPTELLAEQHHMAIGGMLEGSNVRVALVTAGQAPAGSAARRELLDQIAAGTFDLVIGTQALLSDAIRFRDLAVVVTDEQHRFGVMQRARLRWQPPQGETISARTPSPHTLLMTATPIPRTLSLALFGDLDVSTIDALPPGRTPVVTRTVTSDRADEVYAYVAAERVGRGEQVYIVVPAIEESDNPSTVPLKRVREHATMVEQRYFGGRRVAAIHGRLKRATRQKIMEQFRAGQIDVLVATTVIEVGVDVPNATVMIVEHAERFGLAQLHQLRGRVGRNADSRRSLCVFIGDPSTPEASERLTALVETNDGFRIAEHDLRIRGMGEFFGTRQHGGAALRVARIPEDLSLLEMARRDADGIVSEDPSLEQEGHRRLRAVLQRDHGEAIGLVDVG